MSTPGVSIASVKVQTDEKRCRPQNENRPAGYLGWTPVSSHVREPERLLFSSLRFASPARAPDPAPLTPVFLFDKRIHLEAIFTVSARNIVFVLNEIMILAVTR